MRVIAKDTRFECRPGLGEVLRENPRLVIALNHSTPLSWLPAVSLLCAHAAARGGGHRRPIGIMDNFFFHVPFIRDIAAAITQHEKPLSFFELADRFEKLGDIDLVLFPEGSNCFFGNFAEVQEFRSPRFVELAIRAGAPILIGAHLGSERWARSVAFPESWVDQLALLPGAIHHFLERRLRSTGKLVVPLVPKPMERFELLCELYHPRLQKEDLSEDEAIRREQIREEAALVHAKMTSLLRELHAGISQPKLAAPPVGEVRNRYDEKSKQDPMSRNDLRNSDIEHGL